jgi:hypothetical protein
MRKSSMQKNWETVILDMYSTFRSSIIGKSYGINTFTHLLK